MRRPIVRIGSGLILALLLPACGSHSGSKPIPVAPTISNFRIWPEFLYLNSGGGSATVDSSLEFQDRDGDIASLTLTIQASSGDILDTETIPMEEAQGVVDGTVLLEAQVPTTSAGVFTVRVHVTDGQGLVSNELSTSFRITPDPWVTKAAMPVPQWVASGVAANGRIYVLGGRSTVNPDEYFSLVQIYNPATDVWTTGAPMPMAGDVTVAAVSGKIYLFGTSMTYVYDPALDSWAPRTSIPLPRSPGVAVLNGRVYLMGGIDATAMRTTGVEIYDPVADAWSFGAPVPSAYADMAATAAGGKIYLRGGTWIYDAASDSWSPGFGPPDSRWPFGWIAVGNTIYGIGGYNNYVRVDACDLSTGAWTSRTSAPESLYSPIVVEMNGKIYVIEVTYGPPPQMNLLLEYTPANDPT